MAKPKNHGTSWSKSEVAELRRRARADEPTTTIARKLQRTVRGVESKAASKRISLRRPN